MTRTSPFLRRAALALLAIPLVFALSSCNSGQAPAATIDGTSVDGAKFLEGAKLYAELAAANQGGEVPKASDSVDTATTTAYLRVLVQREALHKALEDKGVKVSAAQLKTEADGLATAFPGGKGYRAFTDLPTWFQDLVVDYQASLTALTEHLGSTPEALEQAKTYYDTNRDTAFATWCFDLIVTSSSDAAAAARARVVGGESFATVATDVAKAEGSEAAGEKKDGDVGCRAVSDLSSNLSPQTLSDVSSLEAGEISQPLSLDQGVYGVFRMRSKDAQAFEAVKAQLTATFAQQAVNSVVGKLIQAMDVDVNPRFGSWKAVAGQYDVVAPTGSERVDSAPVSPLPGTAQGTATTPAG